MTCQLVGGRLKIKPSLCSFHARRCCQEHLTCLSLFWPLPWDLAVLCLQKRASQVPSWTWHWHEALARPCGCGSRVTLEKQYPFKWSGNIWTSGHCSSGGRHHPQPEPWTAAPEAGQRPHMPGRPRPCVCSAALPLPCAQRLCGSGPPSGVASRALAPVPLTAGIWTRSQPNLWSPASQDQGGAPNVIRQEERLSWRAPSSVLLTRRLPSSCGTMGGSRMSTQLFIVSVQIQSLWILQIVMKLFSVWCELMGVGKRKLDQIFVRKEEQNI